MLRRLMFSTSATLLTIIAFSASSLSPLITQASEKYTIHCYGETNSPPSVDGGWTRSDKQDDIETFYRYEKTGSDTFRVEVKIINNRPKTVKVQVRVQYKYKTGRIYRRLLAADHKDKSLTQSSQRFSDTCEIITPSGSSGICRDIKVTAEKITGVKIIRWDNVNQD